MSGNYGDIRVCEYNTRDLELRFRHDCRRARPEAGADFALGVPTNMWAFNGLKVQSLEAAAHSTSALVEIKDQGASYPTSNIVFENMTISSQDDVSGWTQAQWVANARSGFIAQSSAGGEQHEMHFNDRISHQQRQVRRGR